MRTKTLRISLDKFGHYLGMERGCFIVRDRLGKTKRFPLFESEIGEVVLKSGNMVSTGALSSLAFWEIDTLLVTNKGRPIAMLKSLEDNSHVKTRVCQYESTKDGRALKIAKQFVKGKTEGQNKVLEKYGLRTDTSVKLRINAIETEDLKLLRRKLTQIEAKFSRFYFRQILQLIPERIRPEGRKTFKAYDGVNNLFNLAYELLSWKVHRALIGAKLEPYLGYLHSEQFGKPSLVCDFQELYRYLVDDFVVRYCQKLTKRDFVYKTVKKSNKKGKREYLADVKTDRFTSELNSYFLTTIDVPRIKIGKRQEIESLINEEGQFFAKYLRGEKTHWEPRIAELR